MKSVTVIVLSFVFFSILPMNAAPKIVLKLDDVSAKQGVCLCTPTMDYLLKMHLKAGFGVIASRFDDTALAVFTPYLNATNERGEKLFEFWHHGFDHVKPEFKETSYAYQKEHFEKADQLIKKYLGIQMHTFGSPYNGSDSVTDRVIAENPNYKVFMFCSLKNKTKKGMMYADHRVNMENGTGIPEFEYFKTNYDAAINKFPDYMILQGHPNHWTAEKQLQFKMIIDFLMAQGCTFVTPYDLYSK